MARIRSGGGGVQQESWRFDNRLPEALSKIRENTDEFVHQWGTDTISVARVLMRQTHVLSGESEGDMADSLEVVPGASGFRNIRTVGIDYAAKNEFGCVNQPARPTMIPAAIIAKDNTEELIAQRGLV